MEFKYYFEFRISNFGFNKFMAQLFNLILYQPIFNALVFLYNIVPGHDIGIAIILLTIVIKLVLYPFSIQAIKSQKALQELQPKLEELKRKYKGQKERLAQEMMLLYKREKVNPLSSCLPLLIQLPFLIAVFQVFRTGLNDESLNLLYPFIENPGHLNSITFGIIDLAKVSIPLAILTGAAQFVQTKMLSTKKVPKVPGSKDEGIMTAMNKQMLYFMPLLTVFIGTSLPAGLMFYWLVTTILTIIQQYFMFKKPKDKTLTS